MRWKSERGEAGGRGRLWEGDAGIEGGGGGKEGGQGGLSSWVSTWWGCCQEDSRDASEAPSSTQKERETQGLRGSRRARPWCMYLPAHTHTCTPTPPEPTRRPAFPTPSRMSTLWVPMCEGRAAHPAGGLPRVTCRSPVVLKSKKLQKPSFHLTPESVKHNLNCQEAIYGLYFSHLLRIFIHSLQKY